jgi:hypothetical protein
MGYLINQNILKVETIVPQSFVANLDVNPFILINTIPGAIGNNYTILAANLRVNGLTDTIAGFGHFYLQYDPSLKCAVYDENISVIQYQYRANFLLNASHPPNRFGSITLEQTGQLSLRSELPPITNCDLIVSVYYFKNF